MNYKQRLVRRGALAAFLLTVLFPPWSYVLPAWSTQCFAGYRFVFAPPPLRTADEFREMFFVYDSPDSSKVVVRIEYVRLIIEWLALLFLYASIVQLLEEDPMWLARIAGVMGVLVGIALAGLVVLFPSCHVR